MNTARTDPPVRPRRLLFGGARSAADLPTEVIERVRLEVHRLADASSRAGPGLGDGLESGGRAATRLAVAAAATPSAPATSGFPGVGVAPASPDAAAVALEVAVARTLLTLYDLTDIDPILVAMEAWRTCDLLAGEIAPTGPVGTAAPGNRAVPGGGTGGCRVVDFGPRGITHTRAQAVRVSVGGRPLGSIPFTVTLTLDVGLMAAALEEERLTRVRLHRCRLTATLATGDEPLCSASRRVDFPASFGLGAGLPAAPTGGRRR
jgi:hypothetical protein